MLVALGAIGLLVSLFMDWYGPLTAWEAFEVVEVALAALAIAALLVAAGLLVPDLEYVERRWLPVVAFAVTVLVAAALVDPPPAAAEETLENGAWLAFGATLVLLAGTILSFNRVSLAVAVEGRELRKRVPVVDHRQDTTETAAIKTTEPEDKPAGRSPGKPAEEG